MKVWRQSVTDADQRTLPSSHTNYKCLSQPELVKRLTNEHQLRQNLTKQNLRLREKIATSTETFGLEVEEELHDDLTNIMETKRAQFFESFSPGSFQVQYLVKCDLIVIIILCLHANSIHVLLKQLHVQVMYK